MKIKIIREDSKPIGWDIIPETEEEKLICDTMRNMLFFGLNETAIRYAGQESENEYVTKLSYRTQGYLDKEDAAFKKRLQSKRKKRA